MPRKPKPKNTLSAGERAALYEAEMAEKRAKTQSGASKDADWLSKETDKKSEAEKKAAEKKPALPKPQFATVKVDLAIETGNIKPMHSMCNGPVSYGADISSLFREIGVPYVRFSETDTAISAYAVDISRIFKDKNADPHDPSNYDFSYTDKYIAAAYNAGARAMFRLGESSDRVYSDRKVNTPEDLDSFTQVCANIVRHYNDYWGDGFAYGIEYFEIWDHPCTRPKDLATAFELYRRVSSALKLIDDGIKVGGMCFSDTATVRDFLKYCKAHRAPIDFVTLSSFDSDPSAVAERVREITPSLYNLGLSDTEIVIGAWGFFDKEVTGKHPLDKLMSGGGSDISEIRRKFFESQASVKGAAYALSFMINAAKIKEAGIACFYDAEPNISPFCAICDRYGNPQKPFYAFKAYGELYRAGREIYTVCEEQQGFAPSGIYAMSAAGDDGYYVLISSFDGCGIVDLRLESIPSDIYTADVYMLDGVKDLTLADSIPVSGEKKRLILNISQYGAALIKLY